MLFEAEARRHPALAGDTPAKGDTVEVAGEIVAPGVVDAGQVVGMAAPLEANEVAAMGAAVDHCMDLAVLPSGDDDRGLAEKGRQVVTRLGEFAGECEILPGRPEKDPAELGAVDLRIRKHPVRNARIALGRPFDRLIA